MSSLSVSRKPLGRKTPTNFDHVTSYPLSALPPAEIPYQVPVTIGINWYDNFDNPVEKDGRFWIGLGKNLGSIRGGHCVCLKPGKRPDPTTWYKFYYQGEDGACVGFGSSRMMSLLNRKRYDARWLWDQAKLADEWPDTNPGDGNGTSVSAGMDVLRTLGHSPWKLAYEGYDFKQRASEIPVLNEGISANRWATTVDEVAKILNSPITESLQAVPFLNSWGTFYPHVTWMPYDVLQRLLDEEGEATLVTDR